MSRVIQSGIISFPSDSDYKSNLSYILLINAESTSKGRVATSGAHTSDVKGEPVGINIVLTWI